MAKKRRKVQAHYQIQLEKVKHREEQQIPLEKAKHREIQQRPLELLKARDIFAWLGDYSSQGSW